MWISENMKPKTQNQNKALTQMGDVSIGGLELSAVTQGEKRNLKVAMAGGYKWTPEVGQNVLVLSTEDGESIVVGVIPDGENLPAGELKIEGDDCYIHLKPNGQVRVEGGSVTISGTFVDINGSLSINGEKYVPYTGGGIL